MALFSSPPREIGTRSVRSLTMQDYIMYIAHATFVVDQLENLKLTPRNVVLPLHLGLCGIASNVYVRFLLLNRC